MIKHHLSAILVFCLLLIGTACGQKETVPTWQEQYDLGVHYLSEGNYEEAIIAFTAAIEIDPKRSEVYIELADVYTTMGDLDAAQKILEDGFAATDDADIQALLDALTASANESTESSMVSEALKLSNLTYRYTSGGEITNMNEGAVGELCISATVDSPDGLSGVPIATWYDEFPDEEMLRTDVEMMVGIWSEAGVFLDDVLQDIPFDIDNSRPVYPDELGKTQYVLLIGLNGIGEAAAYAVVEVKIPG